MTCSKRRPGRSFDENLLICLRSPSTGGGSRNDSPGERFPFGMFEVYLSLRTNRERVIMRVE